ncbi:MAG: hypothetical protein HRJ53_07665 [Acidobacteria bacterium Pan2503]|uniref:Peptidase C39-like domain-containing protein n=1 Tax=Candidatus Acidiferrum panamense TaxID=2741543 RepID=A0A7V8SWG3_9BACT|nr:hypothetical protein [Candidatus Acidoferrum panamensis]
MAVSDWDPRYPVELQDYAWDCAAASTAWALQAAGLPWTEQLVIEGLGPSRISPASGLLDATGAGLVEWLASIGVTAENAPDASFDDLEAMAGFQPSVCGGRGWNHWTGVRMGGYAFDGDARGVILLANPSPGWLGVGQYLTSSASLPLGPFSAVWFTSW